MAMDERPPSQLRAPWPLIEICELSLAKELLAGSSEVTWIWVLREDGLVQVWVGVDAGKQAHHAAAVDVAGRVLWSTRVANDQQAIADLVDRVGADDEVVWAVDLVGCETALLRAMLALAGQRVVYIPGRTVKTMAAGFAGEAKTDARDAVVIANTARMRRDFLPVETPTELIARLALLVAHRADLVEDWVRTVNRLRRLMLGISPVLERALTFTNHATLVLICAYQTPEQIRAAGRDQLMAHLRRHRAVNAAKVADQALAAAAEQDLILPGQDTAAALAAELASHLLQLHERKKNTDKAIEQAFAAHPQAGVIRSLPGMGALAAAEFVVAVGDLSTFASPDHLAAYAGLAPVARDSGKRVANLRRPQRYNRRLRHVFYMSSMSTLRMNGPNRDYYQRKRAEGRKHQQALIALARRRVDVLWALLRDNRCFQLQPPATAPA
ncbi:IS110 family transposase [Micromonospora sp. NPDC049497]|uniref:IS110 family transposase n=1 Tax=Micromonospora sp. NPDC049497 TaxID=3364273 RepID=UPI0037B83818